MLKTKFGALALVAGALAVAAPVAMHGFSAPAEAARLQAVLPSFAPLVKETQPAVVTIRVAGQVGGPRGQQIDPQMREFMERFFGRAFPGQ